LPSSRSDGYNLLSQQLGQLTIADPRYPSVLQQTSKALARVEEMKRGMINYEELYRERFQIAKDRWVKAVKGGSSEKDALYQSMREAKAELGEQGLLDDNPKQPSKDTGSSMDQMKRLYDEMSRGGAEGLMGWTEYSDPQSTDTRILNMAVKFREDMAAVYLLDPDKANQSYDSDTFPPDTRFPVLNSNISLTPVKYTATCQVYMPFDSGQRYNVDPKIFFASIFGIFELNQVSYGEAASILLRPNRWDHSTRERIQSHKVMHPLSHVFNPLPSGTDIRGQLKRFKETVAFLIDCTVVVPIDDDIKEILRQLRVPREHANFHAVREVWVSVLKWDNLLRMATRGEDYYMDLLNSTLTFCIHLKAMFESERNLFIVSNYSSGITAAEMKSKSKITMIITSLAQKFTVTLNEYNPMPSFGGGGWAEENTGYDLSEMEEDYLSTTDVNYVQLQEGDEEYEQEEFYDYNEYEEECWMPEVTVSQVDIDANEYSNSNEHFEHRGFSKSRRYHSRKNWNADIAVELEIPTLIVPEFSDSTEVTELPMITFDQVRGRRKKGARNQFDLLETRYVCELCGREGHCHVDCFSADEGGRLRMLSFANCQEGWENWLNKAFRRALIFRDLNSYQKEGVMRKMEELYNHTTR